MPEEINIPNTHGLVLCGGQSARMGTDKSLLVYHDKPQRYHVCEMLGSFCEKVFISCNEKQADSMQDGHDFIIDLPAFHNTGPMAGLLTAYSTYPGKNFLVL